MGCSGLGAQLCNCCAVHVTSPMTWTRLYSVIIGLGKCWQLQFMMYFISLLPCGVAV